MLLNRTMTPDRRARRMALVGALSATSAATLIQLLSLPVAGSLWLTVASGILALALPLLASTFVSILNTAADEEFGLSETRLMVGAYCVSVVGFWAAIGSLGSIAFTCFGIGAVIALWVTYHA